MTTAIICTGLLGLLVFGLGFAVSGTRARTKTDYGYPNDPAHPMYKMARAHGNATEYAAMLSVLMLFLGSLGPSTWVIWLMWIATGSRYVHAIGLITGKTMAKVHPLRFTGALLTYLAGLALCVEVFRVV